MDAIVVGSLIIVWDFLKPALIGGFYLLLFIATFKWWILDDITKKLDEAVSELKSIERQVRNSHIEMSNMRDSVENIERAGLVKKHIYDDVNDQMRSGFVKSSRSQERYRSGSFKSMTDFEKNLKR